MSKEVKEKEIETKPKKKGKGLVMGIIFGVMIILIAAIVIIFKKDFSIPAIGLSSDSEEFKTYYDVLKKYQDPKYLKETNDLRIKGYKIDGVDNVVLAEEHVVNYEYTKTTLYYIKDGKVIEKEYKNAEIEPLFNTDKEKYGYWLIENKGEDLTYTLLDDIVKESSEPYKFEFLSKDLYGISSNGKAQKIMPTEEHFITFSDSVITESFDDAKDLKKLKRYLKEVIKEADVAENVVFDSDKETVKETLSEIRKKQKEVEEYNSSIEVGSYRLRLGTYTGSMMNMDGTYSSVKVVLNKDNIVVDGIATSYNVRGKFIYVYDFEMFEVNGNNQMVYLAGECPTLTYAG